jgi:hypothetical protein
MHRYVVQIGDRNPVEVDLQKPYGEGDVLVLDGERLKVTGVADVAQVGPPILLCQPIEPDEPVAS